ncbi:hypothetical protein [Caulobacter sp. 1776]|uniref:hypothetical protein n=1 Tax=Caulobacter sp. 1776 TaxID=3156420 RepID=UPI00339506F1
MIKTLIETAFSKTAEFWGEADPALDALRPRLWPPTPFRDEIPTLAPGVRRPCSPMLKARFEHCGRWITATHGHWLSLTDLEALWSEAETAADPFLQAVKDAQIAGQEDWPNEASGLFRPERLTLFAGSDYTYEKIYLLWLDFEDEPEVWAYDANGESRYRDLAVYLQAYIADDVGAASISWRA